MLPSCTYASSLIICLPKHKISASFLPRLALYAFLKKLLKTLRLYRKKFGKLWKIAWKLENAALSYTFFLRISLPQHEISAIYLPHFALYTLFEADYWKCNFMKWSLKKIFLFIEYWKMLLFHTLSPYEFVYFSTKFQPLACRSLKLWAKRWTLENPSSFSRKN